MSEQLRTYLPILIPLAVIELGLLIAALIHIFTHKHYRFGNRWLWVIIAVLINLIGPILYFVIGRGDADDEGDR
ncbi:MAG: PLD nuclease N-terminal domain-containing protein [Propionibacteriaceae bacterium]|nr:PLD nuclease N-terminal domain-containing protein [Propionibacteriaceae bacterium]